VFPHSFNRSFDLGAFGTPSTLLTIAGHDPGSGAGVTADLATFAAHGCFGLSIITALTVQSTRGVEAIQPVDAAFLRRALEFVVADLPPAGIKIGMLATSANVAEVAAFLATASVDRRTLRVLDPILHASSGTALLDPDALQAVHQLMLPVVDWVTPNWMELSVLVGREVASPADAEAAANHLGRLQPHLTIIATGGDQTHPADLLRLPSGETHWFRGEHIESTDTHGTGCAFSSALLAGLVEGVGPTEAVAAAKHFVTEAIRRAPGLGHGNGPLNLLWPLQPE
jgi:hydroxymethylpyrimidine/phosphomethylpyrimidine kinase